VINARDVRRLAGTIRDQQNDNDQNSLHCKPRRISSDPICGQLVAS
jgi:hypothetical protein